MSNKKTKRPYDPKAWEADKYQPMMQALKEWLRCELFAVLFLIFIVCVIIFHLFFFLYTLRLDYFFEHCLTQHTENIWFKRLGMQNLISVNSYV